MIEENERLKQRLEAARTELTTLKRSLKEPEQAVRFREVIRKLSQAIETRPRDAGLHKNRGIAFRHLGEYSKSVQDLNRAIELDGGQASFYNERGTAYFLTRQLARARKDFTRAIALDPKLAEAYHNRAVIARSQGDYTRADKDLRIAQELGVAQAVQTLGAVRSEVSAVQRRLDQLGLAPGPADGIAGSKTVAAIRQLQRSEGLEVTGRVDIATKTALRAARRKLPRAVTRSAPRLLEKPKLEYPAIARERRWEGTVTLRIELLKNGGVGDVEVAKSSGHRVLDESAINSVKSWRHRPASENGAPVTRKIDFDIEFALDKSQKPLSAPKIKSP